MKNVLGVYIGIGLGDISPEVLKLKEFINRKFSRFRLFESQIYDEQMAKAVTELQHIYRDKGWNEPFVDGVVNLATKYAIGYLKKDKILPICFSTEGHMSDMWVGPAAYVGEVLRHENRALHFPTGYDRFALPFKNQTGVDSLASRVGATQFTLDDGTVIKFPAGTPWVASAFSQGSMIWCDFYRQYLMPGKPLNWRLKDLRAAIVCGNPDREKGVCVDWIADKPAPDRQGIMDDADRMKDTPWWWLELARKGDMYTDNESEGERGRNKTAIAKIITQNKWSGGPAGLLARVTDLLTGPMDDVIPITLSLYDAIRFGASGLKAHGGYDMEPAVQFCRERLAA